MREALLKQFEGIVAQYHREILNYVYRLVGNNYEAEDLTQEAFIKAFQKFESLKELAKVRSWLYSIARNVTIDFFRRNKNQNIRLDDMILENYARATATDYRNEILKKEISREMTATLANLPEQDRTIIKLLYYEGFSYTEIGTLLHLNQNTLKSRLHRTRKALFGILKSKKIFANSLA